MADEKPLTTRQAGEQLGVSSTTAQAWAASGLLRAWWTAGNHARIYQSSVDELQPLLRIPPGAARTAAFENQRERNKTLAAQDHAQ